MMSILILFIMFAAALLLVGVILGGNSSKAKRKSKNKLRQSGGVVWQDGAENVNPLARGMIEHAMSDPAIAEWVTQTGLQLLNEQTGITTKLYAGQFDEAVRAYQAHMNVDQFTARDAVTEIARMLKIPVTTRLEDGEIVPHLVADDVQPKRKMGNAD